jgi:O-antigen/teichoic acid export membrane protein
MKKAITQASILTFSNGLSKLLGMLFLVVLTRLIDVAEYGQFRYLFSVASLLSLALIGVPTSLTKFLGERPGDRENKKIFLLNSLGIMGIIYVIVMIVFWLFYENYFLFGVLLLGIAIDSYYVGFSRGLLNITKLSAFRPVKNIVQLVAIGIMILTGADIGVFQAVLFFSFSGLISLIMLEFHKREIEFGSSVSMETIKKIISYMIPVTLGAVGWSVLLTVNPIIIERLRDTESVAYYTAGITLMQVFSFLPEAMSTMILPKVAGISDKRRAIKPFLLGVVGSLFINAVILIVIYLLRERIIIIVFSREYLDIAPIVLLLSVGQISLVTHQLFASFWQGLGKPGVPSITISIGCLANLIGSILLTRQYGIWGASLSFALSTSLSLVLISLYFAIKKDSISRS